MGFTWDTDPNPAAALAKIAAGVEELRAALAADGVDRSEAASCSRMKAIATVQRAFAGVALQELALFHARGAGLHDGALSTRAWLRQEIDLPAAEAGRQVHIARALTALPTVGAAYLAGEFNTDKLLLIHRAAEAIGPEQFAPAETLITEQARELTVPGLRHALTALREAVDPEAAQRDDERRENDRELFLSQTLGGVWSLHGTLTPECGAALSAILTSVTPKPGPEDERTAPQRRHDAAHDLFRAVLDQGVLPNVGGEKPHIGVITHLTDITGPASLSSLNPHCCPTPATCPHDRPSRSGPDGVLLPGAATEDSGRDQGEARAAGPRPSSAQPGVVDGDRPPGSDGPQGSRTSNGRYGPLGSSSPHDSPGRPPHRSHLPRSGQGGMLDGGGQLPSVALRRLSCDAQLYRVVFSPAGAILDIGRSQRTVPPWLRRALTARDGGCRFPSCDRPPPWCDAHHARHWGEGGETSTDNCLLLCRGHHRLVHDGGWHLAFDGTTVTVRRPDGTPFGDHEHASDHGGDPAV